VPLRGSSAVSPNPCTVSSMKNTRSALVLLIAALILVPALAEATALSDLTAATAGNDINNGNNQQTWRWNSSTGGGFGIASTSTTATTGQTLFSVTLNGTNSNGNVQSFAASAQNDHAGTNSTNFGVYGSASTGTHNYGVKGIAATGNAGDAGVWGFSQGSAASYGIYGSTNSSAGYAGYFENTNGGYAAAFLGGNVGIGTATPVNLLDIGTSGGIHIASGVPGATSMALYNNSGTLTWNGVALATGSSVSGTTNYIPVFTGSSSLGNSVIYQSGSSIGIGTATPQSLVHAYGGEVQVGSSGASCAAARGGAIRFSGSTLYYCDGTSTWQTVGGGGSGTVTSSTGGQVAYYQSTGATVIGTSTMNIVGGLVGVNTTSPALLFTVDQSNASAAPDANAGQILIRGYGGAGKGYSGLRFAMHEHSTGWGSDIQGFDDTSSYGGALVFRTGTGSATGTPSERMRIASSGNVGIGLTSPSYTLQVNGSVAGTSAYVNTSDARYKKNIQPLNIGLSIVTQLKPVTFEWKDEVRSMGIGTARPQMSLEKDRHPLDPAMQGKQMGFIAQDVEKVLPSVVVTQPDSEKTKGMKYSELIPVLVRAIQEQQVQLTKDEATIAAMKVKLGM
jgi:hypothetical protein